MNDRTRFSMLVSVMALGMAVVADAGSFFKVGERAPDFSLTSLNGETVTLSALKGKVVVLGLFHICEPCRMQGTNLQKVYEMTRSQPVAVIGVNSSGDSADDVAAFLDRFPVQVTYPYLVDPAQVTDKAYGGGKIIHHVYVNDQEGMIRWQRVGNFFTDGTLAGHDAILQQVTALLPGPGASAAM